MMRQRIHARTSSIVIVGRLLVAALGLGLVWYGLMVALLAFKASPGLVNDISGYRSVYDSLAGLEPADITSRVRLIAALGGLGAFLMLGFLAWKHLPRPYLARGDLELGDLVERGASTVEPRAVERAAEVAARQDDAVDTAAGLYRDDAMSVNVSFKRSTDVAETLRGVQQRVREALERHELPPLPVSVTLTGFDSNQRRELN